LSCEITFTWLGVRCRLAGGGGGGGGGGLAMTGGGGGGIVVVEGGQEVGGIPVRVRVRVVRFEKGLGCGCDSGVPHLFRGGGGGGIVVVFPGLHCLVPPTRKLGVFHDAEFLLLVLLLLLFDIIVV
jgi:hypothetical protein